MNLHVKTTICDIHDELYTAIVEGDEDEAIKLLYRAKTMGEHMENRLKRYRRAIESLGFERKEEE